MGYISIQDLGRFNQQHLGFSASGAADEYAFRYGNYVLGNQTNAAALEITFGQISLSANCSCSFIITGADCQATINKMPIKHWQIHTLQTNDVLTLTAPKNGIYSYLCVYGGIQNKQFLASRTELTDAVKAGLKTQIHRHNKVNENEIPLAECAEITNNPHKKLINVAASDQLPEDYYCLNDKSLTLRFIPHSSWQLLSDKDKNLFLQQKYQLSNSCNKMGYRLSAQESLYLTPEPRLSKPTTLGTIQLPPDGQPIVLMKDRQTIGGYPVIGTVIFTDIPRLAQRRSGQNVTFCQTTLEQAQAQYLAFLSRFHAK